MGVDPCRPRVTGAGEGTNHTLAVQRGAQPLVAHMALDDFCNRRIDEHVDGFRVVGEQVFELGALGRVAEPYVATRTVTQPVSDAREECVVFEEAVDVTR